MTVLNNILYYSLIIENMEIKLIYDIELKPTDLLIKNNRFCGVSFNLCCIFCHNSSSVYCTNFGLHCIYWLPEGHIWLLSLTVSRKWFPVRHLVVCRGDNYQEAGSASRIQFRQIGIHWDNQHSWCPNTRSRLFLVNFLIFIFLFITLGILVILLALKIIDFEIITDYIWFSDNNQNLIFFTINIMDN